MSGEYAVTGTQLFYLGYSRFWHSDVLLCCFVFLICHNVTVVKWSRQEQQVGQSSRSNRRQGKYDNLQNKGMFYISLSSYPCCNSQWHSQNIRLLCWAGIYVIPSLWPVSHSHSLVWCERNMGHIVETLAHLWQAETQTPNPCGGPNPLAHTNEDILMSSLFAGV